MDRMDGKVQKGCYILMIHLPETKSLLVGKLGEILFPAGWYAYVGSAMRGFNARLPHHLREKNKLHWHIDYLLQAASVRRIITFEADTRMECRVAQTLLQDLEHILRFGCSDCRCQSHLFYAKHKRDLISAISQAAA